MAALAAVLFVGTGSALGYTQMQGNIERHDIGELLGEDRPTQSAPDDLRSGSALNVLVLGSDSRDGANDDGSGIDGMRSDTTMIMHLSADRSRVDIVSIPRDTLVDIPSCLLPDGTETPPQDDAIFNSAFSIGGQTGDVGAAAACTMRTVEDLTGIFMDDFVVVDFAGFTNMVNALGGVPMYVPEDIDDPRAELRLSAGCQVLDGHDALGFARVRKSLGDGSDISRIGRQQELVAAIVREALSKNLLTDLPELYQFLDAATSTLTTGTDIGKIPVLAGLANSLRTVDAGDIRFATMPFEWAGPRVRPAPEAEAMWEALVADQPMEASLTGTGEAPKEEPTAEPTPTQAETTEDPTTAAPDEAPGTASETAEPTTPVCTR